MKNIKVVARDEIINPETMQVYDDDGLRILDGYHEEIVPVDEPYNIDAFMQKYEDDHPELKGWSFELTEL